LSLRELFPASEASWRIPTLLLISGGGMAFGGWIGGVLYDYFAFYGPAFATAVLFGMLNLTVLGILVWQQSRPLDGRFGEKEQAFGTTPSQGT
jgi:MFS family permease